MSKAKRLLVNTADNNLTGDTHPVVSAFNSDVNIFPLTIKLSSYFVGEELSLLQLWVKSSGDRELVRTTEAMRAKIKTTGLLVEGRNISEGNYLKLLSKLSMPTPNKNGWSEFLINDEEELADFYNKI
jgi:hypothetical protein